MPSQINLIEQRDHPLRNFAKNLLSGLRSTFFLRLNTVSFAASWGQLVALIFISLMPVLLYNLIIFGSKGQFVFDALPGSLFLIPLVLIAAGVIARHAQQPEQTLLLMVAFIAIAFQIDVIVMLYQLLSHQLKFHRLGQRWYQFIHYAPYVWLCLATGVAAIRLLNIPPLFRFSAVLVTGLLLGLPLATIWHDRTLWAPSYEEDAEERTSHFSINEDAFYLQPKLLAQELSAIKPGRKGIIDLYFVGVAGYSMQDVFMKEIFSISKLFEERFDTKGRTIKLINNPKTILTIPIANSTSLEAALKRVGEIMDRNEDILFLFLTSHGSKETGFSLNFWPLQFHSLDPSRLRNILDQSGIKNRVIVISACYSGIYIASLKNENTLIITAAAADKTSFGCHDKADFTYFNKAYFDEALRTTYSFTEAFESANPEITKREKLQGYESSNPQIFVGENIKPILKKFANRFQK